jgi:hypothetical protein
MYEAAGIPEKNKAKDAVMDSNNQKGGGLTLWRQNALPTRLYLFRF